MVCWTSYLIAPNPREPMGYLGHTFWFGPERHSGVVWESSPPPLDFYIQSSSRAGDLLPPRLQMGRGALASVFVCCLTVSGGVIR
jgi:hypothetical protein